jgi:hypothetical protein
VSLPSAAVERVVAEPAFQFVGAGVTGQGVVEITAEEVLDAGQGVGAGIDRVLLRRRVSPG